MSDREERTEAPSAQKRRIAREEGRLVRSRDLVAVLSVLVVLLVARHSGGVWTAEAETSVSGLLRGALISTPLSTEIALGALVALAAAGFALFLPVALIAGGTSLLATLAQTGWLLRPARILPSWQRLGPRQRQAGSSGSPGALWRAVIAAAKCGWLVLALWLGIEPFAREGFAEELLAGQGLRAGLSRSVERALDAAVFAAWGLLALAALDWIVRKWSFERSLRMSRQELIEERAEQETSSGVRRGRRRLARVTAARRGRER